MNKIKTFFFGSRKRKILSTAATLSLIATSAFAAWLISSHGQGKGRLGNLQQPTVSAATAGSQDLFPGSDGTAYFSINNPNNSALKVIAVADGDGTGTSSNNNCPATNLSVNAQSGLSITVPKGTSDVSIPAALHLASDAPNACQGEDLTRDVSLSFSTP